MSADGSRQTKSARVAVGNGLRDHLHDTHRLLAGLVLPALRSIQTDPSNSVDDDRVHGLIILIALLSGALLPLVEEAIRRCPLEGDPNVG